MRRIIHNTTAIAATIALLMPQLALAEMRLPNDRASKEAEKRSTKMPNLASALQDELAAGLTVDSLICANGDARPCGDKVRLMTPRGVMVEVAEDDTIILAPERQQVNEADAEGKLTPRDGARAAANPVGAEPVVAEATTESVAGALAEALRQAQGDDATEAAVKAAETLLQEAVPKPEQRPRQRSAESAKPAVALDPSLPLRLLESDQARQRYDEMPRLARVLRAEIGQGLTLGDLSCQNGDALPCPKGVTMVTPRGIAVAVNTETGNVALRQLSQQTNTVTAEGDVLPRAPESDTIATAAAKEAAAAATSPVAAALEAAMGQGHMVEEEKVTEENTRSSAEDFEASLRAALQQAATGEAPQRNAAAENEDDNDLAKALILGLGAVAVGSMLNNNRQVALATPDRVVVERADGSQEVIKDEVALLRQPGSTVATENFDDGSSRTIVTREDGSKVVTIRDTDLRVLRRTLIAADGKSTMLIDDTADVKPVDVASLPEPAPVQTTTGTLSEDELRAALQRESDIDRRFTLGQIRNIPEVRALVAPVNIDAITFDTGSAAINPNQAQQLASLGRVIQDAVAKNPREVFMIEGHTDTVGAGAMNLALSDRRAESVALALSEYFDVPPENMVVQGYGEQFLKVRAEGDIRANRRASVRRITDLLQTAQAN
ncbi:OmpA family protein [Paracoccus zhejiangensis]|uniref:Flagellar motor protein MotB n=1 Tax=Paracoccus zhejiangensis TaxID=1077935 RepID=A0A2H5EYF5_9RHOB|nr:OmpA family protein [Paracoccus zhejiangensis]AUH64317.1 flagellar motor protein MotB [Paracoccus zhejiangensis]